MTPAASWMMLGDYGRAVSQARRADNCGAGDPQVLPARTGATEVGEVAHDESAPPPVTHQASIDDYLQLGCGRRGTSANRRNNLAKLDSLVNADSPELIANRAVRLDRIALIEHFHKIGQRKAVLHLCALALRACCCEDNRVTHGLEFRPCVVAQSIGEASNIR